MHQSVPKFSSFKPHEGAPAFSKSQISRAVGHLTDQKPRNDETERSEDESTAKPRNYPATVHARKRSPTTRQRDQCRSTVSDNSIDDAAHFYIVDRTGDKNNLVYGSNSSFLVPAFYTSPKRKILGNSRLNFSDRSSIKFSLSTLNGSLCRTLHSEGQYLAEDVRTIENADEPTNDDFLPLRSNKRRKRYSALKIREIFPTTAYVTGTEEDQSNDCEQSDFDGGSEGSDIRVDYQKQNISLRQCVKERPHDVDAWLELINFQDRWMKYAFNSKNDYNDINEQRTTAEVRVSLYADALKKISRSDCKRELLVLGMMREGERVWTAEKLLSKWRDVIAENSTSLNLRLEFINLVQTTPTCFGHEDCLDQYKIYLNSISGGSGLSAYDRTCRGIHALTRLTCYLRDAGYNELALSIWQSLLELTCIPPDNDGYTRAQTLESFEKYWEYGYPRIGEDGFRGWHRCREMSSSRLVERVEESHIRRSSAVTESILAWLEKEEELNSKFLFPLGTGSFDREGDPYRVVMFEDIRPFLIDIPFEHRKLLIDGFLCWCMLPSLSQVPENGSCTIQKLWEDPFLRSGKFNNCTRSQNSAITPGSEVERMQNHAVGSHAAAATTRSLSALDLSNTATCTETLFYFNRDHFALFSDSSKALPPDMGTFVLKVLQTLTNAMPNDVDVAEYFLAYVFAAEPLKAKKTAKAMLKHDSSNLVLYNVYGLLESHLGNHDASSHVFAAALSLANSMSDIQRLDIVLLQRTWVWEALRRKGVEPASKLLLEAVAANADTLEHKLSSTRALAMRHSLQSVAALLSELLALKSYLLSNITHGDLHAALQTFSEQFEAYGPATHNSLRALELLHQAQAQLVQYHVENHKIYSAKLIRNALRSSIRAFPSNTMILSAFTSNERLFVVDNLRHPITRELFPDGEQSIISWFHVLKTEIDECRRGSGGANLNSIRSLFQKATSSESVGKHSEPVWVAYLNWEIENQALPYTGLTCQEPSNATNLHLATAKQVWLSGLARLPWIKRYYVLGVRLLWPNLTKQEVLGYISSISDRGLRIFTDLRVTT